MDKGMLFNLALAYLGKPKYEASTPDAEYIEEVAQHCIELALDYTSWTFATKRTLLALEKGKAMLPYDCLRVQRVGARRFAIYERELVVEDALAEVELIYTSDEWVHAVAVPDGQPSFAEGVALLTASKAAPRLTSRFDLAETLERKGYEMLMKAKLKDARQVDSNDQDPRCSGMDSHYLTD